MKKICLAIGLLLISGQVGAVTPQELADQAQDSYQSQNYVEAIRFWNELGQIGFVNGDLYYNIGSAYWRLGQAGQARRYFLAATQWSPRDPALRQNLAFVESKLEPSAPAAEGPRALLKKLPLYRLALNLPESLWLLALTSLAFFGFLSLYRWKKQPLWIVLASISLPFMFFGSFQYLSRSTWPWVQDQAVVISPEMPLREQPLTEAPQLEKLREGRLVRLKKVQGDFALVKSPSGKEGWAERSQLGEIP